MQPILRPVDTVLNFGIQNSTCLPCLDYSYSHRPGMDKFGTGTNFIFAILGVKNIPVVPFPDRPYFFLRPSYFFKAIDRATLFSLGGCALLPKWRLLSH